MDQLLYCFLLVGVIGAVPLGDYDHGHGDGGHHHGLQKRALTPEIFRSRDSILWDGSDDEIVRERQDDTNNRSQNETDIDATVRTRQNNESAGRSRQNSRNVNRASRVRMNREKDFREDAVHDTRNTAFSGNLD